MSLRELLTQQKQLLSEFEKHLENADDEAVEGVELDLSEVFGDIKDKTDAIKFVIDSIEANAAALKEKWINPLVRKHRAMENEVQRIKDYVKTQMQENGHEKLPGHAFQAALQRGKPSVVCSNEPGPSDFLAYPDFVVQHVNYSFNKDAIKTAIDEGKELPFARLVPSVSLRFRPITKSLKGSKGEE